MFEKKKCPRCNKGVKESFGFCPSCGFRLAKNSRDYGMIGKSDFDSDYSEPESFLESFSGKVIDKVIGSTFNSFTKLIEKEMKKDLKEMGAPQQKIRLVVNGKEIPINQVNSDKQENPIKKEILSEKLLKKLQTFPRKEAETKVKRLSSGITYEVFVPGVKSMENVLIIKLEESLEIKAIGDKMVYTKIIPLNLPLKKYSLKDEKLILSFNDKD
jgi:hypothetical protein